MQNAKVQNSKCKMQAHKVYTCPAGKKKSQLMIDFPSIPVLPLPQKKRAENSRPAPKVRNQSPWPGLMCPAPRSGASAQARSLPNPSPPPPKNKKKKSPPRWPTLVAVDELAVATVCRVSLSPDNVTLEYNPYTIIFEQASKDKRNQGLCVP